MKTIIYCEDKYGRKKNIAEVDGQVTITNISESDNSKLKWWPSSYEVTLSNGMVLSITEDYAPEDIKCCFFR